jgi:hypothetical protein
MRRARQTHILFKGLQWGEQIHKAICPGKPHLTKLKNETLSCNEAERGTKSLFTLLC